MEADAAISAAVFMVALALFTAAMVASQSRPMGAAGIVEALTYPVAYRVRVSEGSAIVEGPGVASAACFDPSGRLVDFHRGELPIELSYSPGCWVVVVGPAGYTVVEGEPLTEPVYVSEVGLTREPPPMRPYVLCVGSEYTACPAESMWVHGRPTELSPSLIEGLTCIGARLVCVEGAIMARYAYSQVVRGTAPWRPRVATTELQAVEGEWEPLTIPPGKPYHFSAIDTPYGPGLHIDTCYTRSSGYDFMIASKRTFKPTPEGTLTVEAYLRQYDTFPTFLQPGRRLVYLYILDPSGSSIVGKAQALDYADGTSWRHVVVEVSGLDPGSEYRVAFGRPDLWVYDWRLTVELAGPIKVTHGA